MKEKDIIGKDFLSHCRNVKDFKPNKLYTGFILYEPIHCVMHKPIYIKSREKNVKNG